MPNDDDLEIKELPITWNTLKGDDLFWNQLRTTLYNNKIIILHGEINEIMSMDIVYMLEALATKLSDKDKPIRIIMNSIGGEVYSGLLIHDTIKNLISRGYKVIIEARGLVASIATVILQAGSKRVSTKNTRFLIHEISTISAGKTTEQTEQVEELKKTNTLLATILAERAGKTVDDIERLWRKRDVWMSSEEAKEFGLIDEIV